jgi:hypothetical protein
MTNPDWLKPKQYKRYIPHMKKPRLPTEAEKKECLDYLMLDDNDTSEQSRSNVESMIFGGDSLVAVFDDYQTYMGKYTGKLMVIIGDIDPRENITFIWQDGKITEARTAFKKSSFYRMRRKKQPAK